MKLPRTSLAAGVVAWGLLFAAVASVEDRPANPTRVIVIEDFESYTTDAEVAKAWYKPPHGGEVHQTLDRDHKGQGRQSLKVSYRTTADSATHYSPFCRVANWNLSGCDAIQFWLKPDGLGRQLLIELNIANPKGRNILDLWDARYVPQNGDVTPRLVTVPFQTFVHNTRYAESPDVSPVLKPEAVIEVAFCIGSRNDEPGAGAYNFDDLCGVNTNPNKSP